jgi:P27 family predicted phage terminase small subunit
MPPRKRAATKIRRSTARSDRERRFVTRTPGAPPAPADLEEAARAIFERLAQAMADQGTAIPGDRDVLALTSGALVDVARLDAILRAQGATYEHGALIRPRPECMLRDQAWKRGLAGLKALGLAPSSRGLVEPVTAPAATDPLERLLRRRELASGG